MAHLPVVKLGALLIKTLTKPLAKDLKEKAIHSPKLNYICCKIGQFNHNVNSFLVMRSQELTQYKIKPLPDEQAVAKGAEFLGEMLIFSVGAILVIAEYTRSSNSARDKAARETEQQKMKDEFIHNRFKELEDRIIELEKLQVQSKRSWPFGKTTVASTSTSSLPSSLKSILPSSKSSSSEDTEKNSDTQKEKEQHKTCNK